MREIKSITFKRIHIASTRGDKAGHWWFEIGPPGSAASESFGWWPSSPVTLPEVFLGVDGELNNGLNGMSPARDPHHGEVGDEEFHPVVKQDDRRTDAEIADCLRKFAMSYNGVWQWFLGWGQNCHTFQRAAMKHCRLLVPRSVRKAKL